MLEMNFEQALKTALFDDLEKEYGQFLNSGFELPPHSKKYLRFEKKILRDPMGYVHQSIRPVWKTVLQKVALIIIAITVFIGLMMTIPPVRAFVFSVVEELAGYDKHSTDEIKTGEMIRDYDIGYLPDGYIEDYDNNTGIKVYSNGDFSIMFIYDYANKATNVLLDKEHLYVSPVTIGTNTGSIYESIDGTRKSVILWYDRHEKVYFILSSNIELEELIKVAESVHPAE